MFLCNNVRWGQCYGILQTQPTHSFDNVYAAYTAKYHIPTQLVLRNNTIPMLANMLFLEQMSWFSPCVHPTNGISTEFEIRSTFTMLWFKSCMTDHNENLYTSRQCYCRDVCNISLWSAEYVMNNSIAKLIWISNSSVISFVGRTPGCAISCWRQWCFV